MRPQVEAVVTSHTQVNLRAMDERLFTAMIGTTIGETQGMIRLCVPLSVVKRLLRDERDVVSERDLTVAPETLPTANAVYMLSCDWLRFLIMQVRLDPRVGQNRVDVRHPMQVANLRTGE